MAQGGTVLKPPFPKLNTCFSQFRRHHYQRQEGNTQICSNVFKLRAIACVQASYAEPPVLNKPIKLSCKAQNRDLFDLAKGAVQRSFGP